MRRMQLFGLLVFGCLLFMAASVLAGSGPDGPVASSASATVRYVATTGSDTGNNCASSASPCRTVQRAVDQAGTGDEIRVATGTYAGVQTRNGLNQVVYLEKTLTLRGGYTVSNWNVSNPTANPTTLDAGGMGRVMVVTGTIAPTVEGLRITGGNCTGQAGAYPWDDDAGGGIYIHTAATTIRNCEIYENYSPGEGGGLYLHTSAATLADNHIRDNVAVDDGAGVAMGNSAATLQNNTIEGNDAQNWRGGGLFMFECDATLTGNSVRNNEAHEGGGGAYIWWGEPVLTENTFSGNIAYRGGGGLALFKATAALNGNIVIANTSEAGSGGGIYMNVSDSTLDGNFIGYNTASNDGGGIDLYWSDATLTNNVIAGNQAGGNGAALVVIRSSPTLKHTTIANNIGASGVLLTDLAGVYSSPTFRNTILSGHAVGVLSDPGNTANFNATLLYGNTTNWSGTGITHTNDHTGNPVFVNPGGGDYHIGHTSAAIDHGIDAGVTADMDGDARPWGAGYDLGADEYTGGTVNTATPTATPTRTPTVSATPTQTHTPTCPDDGYEDNDTCQDATAVVPGTYQGLKVCSGDDDWYEMYLTAGDTITVTILFIDDLGDLDLSFYDRECGGHLKSSTSASDDEQVIYTILFDGTYGIRVFGYQGAANSYSLMVEAPVAGPTSTPTRTATRTPTVTRTPTATRTPTCADDRFENNDTCAAAVPIRPDIYNNLQVCSNDEDWYSITLRPYDKLTVTTLFVNALGNLDLQLFEADCTTVAYSSATYNNSEQLTVEVARPTTFNIRVYGRGGDANSYSMYVEIYPFYKPRMSLPVVMKK